MYHLHCFTCGSCGVPLATGDQFGMRDGLVYCRPHYELLDYCDSVEQLVYHRPSSPIYYAGGQSPGSGVQHKGRPRKRKIPVDRDGCSPLRMSTAPLGKNGFIIRFDSILFTEADVSIDSKGSRTGATETAPNVIN